MEPGEVDFVAGLVKNFGFVKCTIKNERGLVTLLATTKNNLPLGSVTFSDVSASFANETGVFHKSNSVVNKKLANVVKIRTKKYGY